MSVKVSVVFVSEAHFSKGYLQVDDVVEPLLESTEKVLVQFPFSLNLKIFFSSVLSYFSKNFQSTKSIQVAEALALFCQGLGLLSSLARRVSSG